MRVSYKRLWKLLIDKDMKKTSFDMRQVLVRVRLQSLLEMNM